MTWTMNTEDDPLQDPKLRRDQGLKHSAKQRQNNTEIQLNLVVDWKGANLKILKLMFEPGDYSSQTLNIAPGMKSPNQMLNFA
jgi:hypothetical protein